MSDGATISGAPEGFNCLLSASNYGSRVVRATGIAYGIDISGNEDDIRDDAVFYTLNVTDSAFALSCVFKSSSERETFAKWLQGWAEAVAANRRVGGYITVRCPARNFVRTAVWQGGLVYGDAIGTVSYPLTLIFVAAADPTSAIGKSGVAGDSTFEPASRDIVDAPMFYPAYYVNGASGDNPEVIYDRNKAAEDAKVLKGIGSTISNAIDPIMQTFGDLLGGG